MSEDEAEIGEEGDFGEEPEELEESEESEVELEEEEIGEESEAEEEAPPPKKAGKKIIKSIARPMILSKYQLAALAGRRIRQLNNDLDPYIEPKKGMTNEQIFQEELRQGKLPDVITIKLANGEIQKYPVSEMKPPK